MHSAIPLKVCKKLMSYVKGLTLRNPSEMITPVTIVAAFDCLKVTQGFYCSICNSLYGTSRSIEEHCRGHRWMKPEDMSHNQILSNVSNKPRWKSQTIQTFFRGTDVKYFTVIDNNPPPSNSEKMNLLNQMLESAKLKDEEL